MIGPSLSVLDGLEAAIVSAVVEVVPHDINDIGKTHRS